MHKELAAAATFTGYPLRRAIKKIPDYQPDFIDILPLLNKSSCPRPSRVWPTYGLAMLRSDESSDYWTNDDAIAVFQIMSQGYGHDHRDKFSIMLHGAGRLLYPDYNAVQYENPALGWTRNTIAHNTVMVDRQITTPHRQASVTISTVMGIHSRLQPMGFSRQSSDQRFVAN
ncbi:MAG: heparinase II/III family protein [Candidatus Competibacteraceae bacterium]